jgi:two-component system sensor histidine kinase/response regulator
MKEGSVFEARDSNRPGRRDALVVTARISAILASVGGLLTLFFTVAQIPATVAAVMGVIALGAVSGPLVYLMAVAPLSRRAVKEADHREDAERTTKLQSAYFSTMSHELRTPLNAVLGMADLLHEQPLETEARGYVDVIRSSGSTLLALINDVLDLSKIEAQHLELESHPFDPQHLIEETLTLLAPMAFGKGVSLVADLSLDGVGLVVGDQTRLKQVLYNLLGNAVKFSSQGDVVLRARRIAPTAQEPQALRIEFSIRDRGIGIAAENVPHLFEPFTQAEASTARRFGGTGLGLAISKRLVEAMGGKLGVTSTLGEGTTFYFSALFTGWSPAPARTPTLTDVRILLIGDSELTLRTITRNLAGTGAQVDVQSGGDCVVAVAQHQPEAYDLVMVDHQLAVGDGCQIVVRLSGLPATAQARYLLLSGPGQPVCAEAAALGAMQLAKPVVGSTLDRKIAGILGRTAHLPGIPAVPEEPDNSALAGLRVLIADDHVVNQRVLQLTLERFGLDVDVVSDGEQAVNAVLSEQYDAVLMDLHMPAANGLQATRRIRARHGPHAPVIIGLTAAASTQDRDNCIGAGMDGYLVKPVRAQDLRRVLIDCLAALPSPEELAAEPIPILPAVGLPATGRPGADLPT